MTIMKSVFHLSVGLIFLSFLGGVGCTTKAEQAASSKEEVRGDSDRFFHKMEQEEKTRGSSNKE